VIAGRGHAAKALNALASGGFVNPSFTKKIPCAAFPPVDGR
jgi:hypothetical protein